MIAVVNILFAAGFTGATSYCLGMLLFRRLRLRFTRGEEVLYGFVVGAALLSALVFLLTAANLARTWSFAALGVGVTAIAVRKGACRLSEERLPRMPRFWLIVFLTCFAAYGAFYLMNALAPEVSPDGTAYHLGLVSRYFRQHGFGRITTNMYANLSMGVEMLFLFAFAFGRHSGAATVHFLFYLALPLTMLAFARRMGLPAAGAAAALLVMLSPVIGTDGSSAYIDVAMACVLFTLFCLLQIWDQERESALLIPIGLLAGFAYACKLTAFVAIPYTLAFIGWKLLRARKSWFRSLAVVSVCIAAIAGPWLLKNAIVVGNPFSPFLNRYFPNPYVRISFEEEYLERNRHYEGIESPAQIPVEATIRGGLLQGLLGPAFLLLPLSLFALRWPLGRQLLLAGAVFTLTYFGNIGTRFLIGGLPFWSLALAMVLCTWRGMAAAVVLFHAFVCWPSVMRLYCDPASWRIDKFYWRPALRIQSEHDYLSEQSGGYLAAKLAEDKVPPDGRIFMFGGIAEAYCQREILVGYQGGFNNMLGDLITTGGIRDYQPIRSWTFSFPARPLHGVRVVQTAEGGKGETWSIAELHVLSDASEVPRTNKWRLRATPNPWDVQMAFDNCPITRWSSWERARPGMSLEAEFGESQTVSAVRIDLTPLSPRVNGRLEGEIEPGRWVVLAASPSVAAVPPPPHSRKTAMDDLKRFGITHLSINDGDFLAGDISRNRKAWGLTLLGEAGGNKLYRID